MEPYIKLKKYLLPVFWGGLLLLGLRYLVPLMLPVLLGLGLAALLSPLIRRVQQQLHLRWATASGLCITGVLVLLGLGVTTLGRFLLRQLAGLYDSLPGMMESISQFSLYLAQWAQTLAQQLPGGAGDAIFNWSNDLLSSGGTLMELVYQRLFSLVSGFLTGLPDTMLFLLTLLLSAYFGSPELPRLRAFLREKLPGDRWRQAVTLGQCIKTVLLGWLRAQVKLMGITFLILLTGFLLLQVRFSLLLSLGIAVLDALPLFGTGTVLIPWGLFSLISGDFYRGIGLMVLYGAAALCRNVLEPKFLGEQMGVSALVTLLSIYAGYHLYGVLGMILLPIFTMLTFQVLEVRSRGSAPSQGG